MNKLLFIYNPFAGKSKIRANLSNILEKFSAAGYEITVFPTRQEHDALQIATEHAGNYDLVVCSGGDGTLDEVVGGVLRCGKECRSGTFLRAVPMILRSA